MFTLEELRIGRFQTLAIVLLLISVEFPATSAHAQCANPTPEQICENPGVNDFCWDGGGVDNSWTTEENWDSATADRVPPLDGTANIYHLIGGTIEMNAGTDIAPILVASMTVRGSNGGKIVVQSGKGLQVESDFINCDTQSADEYVLEVEDAGLLRVQDSANPTVKYDLQRVKATHIGDAGGEGGTVELTGAISTVTSWVVETDSRVDASSISIGNSWTVEPGATVTAGTFGPTGGLGAGIGDGCGAVWDINNGHVEVGFAENPICWEVTGDPNETGGNEEIDSSNKIVALRIVLDSEAEVVVGDQSTDWGLLLAKKGEAVIDDSTMTLQDVKAREESTITLRNSGVFVTENMTPDPGNPGGCAQNPNVDCREGFGSLFYGIGYNVFQSLGNTNLTADGAFESDAIISVDQEAEGTPNLAMTIGGNLNIISRTDVTFTYTINVEQQDETTIDAAWDTSGVSLFVAAGTAQQHTTSNIEVLNVDFDGVWFCDNDRMKAWHEFSIGSYADATLVNGTTMKPIMNQFHGTGTPAYPDEAMYVDGDVLISPNATLDLNGLEFYVPPSAVTNNGTISNGTITVVATKTCYGDFDNDGDVDLTDRDTFCAAVSGSGLTSNVLADYDLDGDVDATDQTAFCANFNGQNNSPRCACFPGGAGSPLDSCPDPLCPWTRLALSCHRQTVFVFADRWPFGAHARIAPACETRQCGDKCLQTRT